jgi:hypothetical protein
MTDLLKPAGWTKAQLARWLDDYRLDYDQTSLMRGLGTEAFDLPGCPICHAVQPTVFLWNGNPTYKCACRKSFSDLEVSICWDAAVLECGGSRTKAGVEFATLELAAQACKAIGVRVPVDGQLKGRLAVVKNNGTVTIEVEKGKADGRPKGWNGTDKKTRWTYIASHEAPESTEDGESAVLPSLVDFAKSCELFHTPAGECFATVDVQDHRETYRIKSPDFRKWLNYKFYQKTGGAPSSKAMAEAINAIEAIASFEGDKHEDFCRLGRHGDKLYLDLCNDEWEVVEIDRDGWRVMPCPSHIKFRRAKGQLALPHPEPGDINELRPLVNVTDESWVLLVASLVASLRYPGPYFITLILAGHGGAKTTVLKFMRSLFDPNTAAVRSPPSDEHSLFLAAMNGLLICLDNISLLKEWLLDSLCRVSTGGGFGVREHYTQTDEHLCAVMRPTMVTAIAEFSAREDFLSRCLVIRCPMIPKGSHKPESEIFAEFETARPRVLGALLTAASTAIRNLPHTQPEQLPRMADAFRWVVAAETGLGWEPGTFARHYLQCEHELDLAILEQPVAIALKRLLDETGKFEGPTTQLFTSLQECADSQLLSDQLWPRTVKALGAAMKRLTVTLAKNGISVSQGSNRHWIITPERTA